MTFQFMYHRHRGWLRPVILPRTSTFAVDIAQLTRWRNTFLRLNNIAGAERLSI